MKAYASIEHYKAMFPSDVVNEKELLQQLEMATHEIDGLTYNRISSIAKLHERQQELICKATCLQVNFKKTYGEFLNSPFSSYSINGVSMSFAQDKVLERGGVVTLSSIYALLLQTGLADRRVW